MRWKERPPLIQGQYLTENVPSLAPSETHTVDLLRSNYLHFLAALYPITGESDRGLPLHRCECVSCRLNSSLTCSKKNWPWEGQTLDCLTEVKWILNLKSFTWPSSTIAGWLAEAGWFHIAPPQVTLQKKKKHPLAKWRQLSAISLSIINKNLTER